MALLCDVQLLLLQISLKENGTEKVETGIEKHDWRPKSTVRVLERRLGFYLRGKGCKACPLARGEGVSKFLQVVGFEPLPSRLAIFQRHPRPEKEYQSFSLIYNDRSLDLMCKDKDEAEVWFVGLKALIPNSGWHKCRNEPKERRTSTDGSNTQRPSSVCSRTLVTLYIIYTNYLEVLSFFNSRFDKEPRSSDLFFALK
ncbi:hypothetical protein Cgig2_024838 [Carnegiea gigantea]|uniref:PH domain-containing protein n=1 Tax=Carnegiea gigantea TaxID=171969 RepID=A0A9Q1KC14_9CARY|nr:hypothetical protein Cgig2_024838 [Carnegiea gigantea]